MKKFIEFSVYNAEYDFKPSDMDPRHVPAALFQEMRARWPNMVSGDRNMKFVLEVGSDAMAEVLAFLWEKQHVRPILDVPVVEKRKPFEFGVIGRVEFSPEEESNAPILRLFSYGTPIHSLIQDAPPFSVDGKLIVAPPKVGKSKLIGHNGINQALFCKPAIKVEMQSTGFIGLDFNEVEYSQKSRPPRPEEELWQISSSVVMPPVLNPLMEGSKAPFTPSSRDCYPADRFMPWVLRYSFSAVARLGDFDIALTREEFGVRPRIWGATPWLIVSQRFRRWLLERKLKDLSFTPVILEHE